MEARAVGKNDPCPCNSGKKYRQCCWLKRFDHDKPKPALLGDGANTQPKPAPQSPHKTKIRVGIDYRFSDGIGIGEVSYCFDVNQEFLLTNGLVVPADKVEVGMKFYLEGGLVATITAIRPPEVHDQPPPGRDANGNSFKRVLGTVRYSGQYPVLDLVVGDLRLKTTPGHRFYSFDRSGWVDAETLEVGEQIETEAGTTAPVTHVSPWRVEKIDLYNLEVEDFHTYFVGKDESAVWSHNGLDGSCNIPKPVQRQKQIPESDGYWSSSSTKGGPKDGAPGESYWHSTDARVTSHPEYQPIKFTNRYPEFEPVTRVRVEVELTGKPGSGDHKAAAKALAKMLMADPALAERLAIPFDAYTRGKSVVKPNATGVLNWMKKQPDGGLTWHHSIDMKSMQMVPTDIHSIPHAGGADLLRQASGIKLKPERWRKE